MKVKVIKNYFDKQLKKDMTPKSAPFEVSEERAKTLVSAGVCEIVPTPTTDEVAKKPKAKKEA